jgi:hypothetical protein
MPDDHPPELLNPAPDPLHYLELAWLVRVVAQRARSGYARKELLRRARSFEYRAKHRKPE